MLLTGLEHQASHRRFYTNTTDVMYAYTHIALLTTALALLPVLLRSDYRLLHPLTLESHQHMHRASLLAISGRTAWFGFGPAISLAPFGLLAGPSSHFQHTPTYACHWPSYIFAPFRLLAGPSSHLTNTNIPVCTGHYRGRPLEGPPGLPPVGGSLPPCCRHRWPVGRWRAVSGKSQTGLKQRRCI